MVTVNINGNLTADPVLNNVNGRSCCNFNIAARTRKKDSEGNLITEFYRVTTWGYDADNCAKYLTKGRTVAVIGALDHHAYMSQNGEPRSGAQITAYQVEFISPTGSREGGSQHQQRQQEYEANEYDDPVYQNNDDEDDDDIFS